MFHTLEADVASDAAARSADAVVSLSINSTEVCTGPVRSISVCWCHWELDKMFQSETDSGLIPFHCSLTVEHRPRPPHDDT